MMRLLLGTTAIALIVGLRLLPVPADKVAFLDIGQGDSILLQSGTQQVLIDGGPGAAVLERLAEELPWFDRTIDVLIVTHPQRDHVEGLIHVLERYRVKLVLLPNAPHDSGLQATWLTKIEEQNIPYRFAWAGQELTVGDLTLNIIAPLDTPAAQAATRADINNASTSARVDFHNLSFLLTGDAEKRVETLLVNTYASSSPPSSPIVLSSSTSKEEDTGRAEGHRRPRRHGPEALASGDEAESKARPDAGGATPGLHARPASSHQQSLLDVDILKAGHHGSNSSTHQPLIDAATPKAVVISVGAENHFGHPHPAVLKRLENLPVWRTDQHGTVRFLFKDGTWHLKNG